MDPEREAGHLWGIVLAAGDGTRVQRFLSQLCGGRGIKQFCAVIGQRSMLQHTLARVERLIPRQRILVVVSRYHREEVAQQLSHWPKKNLIFQPENRDTTAGILLPLAYISHRDPLATVAIFPSDHFVLHEQRFMDAVRQAVEETQKFPWNVTLLGIVPDRAEEGYGWIVPGGEEAGRGTRPVLMFWEKPPAAQTHELWRKGALWNSFVCVAHGSALWQMTQQLVPNLYEDFGVIRQAIGTPAAARLIEKVYVHLPAVNFSAGICEPLAAALRVLPVSATGWSDWGSAERIWATVEQLGRQEEYYARAARGQRPQMPALLRAPEKTLNLEKALKACG